MSACIRCHGNKFDPTYRERPVKDPIKVAETRVDGKRERTVPVAGGKHVNQGCWWCSAQGPVAHCSECGFCICEGCAKNVANPPEGPSQATPEAKPPEDQSEQYPGQQ